MTQTKIIKMPSLSKADTSEMVGKMLQDLASKVLDYGLIETKKALSKDGVKLYMCVSGSGILDDVFYSDNYHEYYLFLYNEYMTDTTAFGQRLENGGRLVKVLDDDYSEMFLDALPNKITGNGTAKIKRSDISRFIHSEYGKYKKEFNAEYADTRRIFMKKVKDLDEQNFKDYIGEIKEKLRTFARHDQISVLKKPNFFVGYTFFIQGREVMISFLLSKEDIAHGDRTVIIRVSDSYHYQDTFCVEFDYEIDLLKNYFVKKVSQNSEVAEQLSYWLADVPNMTKEEVNNPIKFIRDDCEAYVYWRN